MTLSAKTRLGPYEILAPIGAGGMGEVYKANDTRLDRTVAIKVLPEHLAESPERRARFEREAKAISQLNHPNICTLHDIGEQDGTDYLVMEYIEGETLAEILKKGSLPLDRSLEYGIQVADGLDKAHRAGIVHRDLKPGNIMLTKSGVKLLDFGLAKVLAGETNSEASDAPTQQKDLTQEQAIVGTLQYMAPEQLEGKDVDARTDVFAFGVVLYEMLAGARPFAGDSSARLIAAILESEPRPLPEVSDGVPLSLASIAEGCLAKDPDDRWQSMADVARQLRWIAKATPEEDAPRTSRRGPARWPVPALVAVAATLVAAASAWWLKPDAEALSPLVRLTIPIPPGDEIETVRQSREPLGRNFALSPEGQLLVYGARRDGTSQLFLRPLDRFEATPIAGTDGGYSPFFSPDGTWIGFFTKDKLRKVPVEGGIPVTLASVPRGGGGSWGSDGQIVVTSADLGLLRISADGGEPESLRPDRGRTGASVPHLLPDGDHVLFSAGDAGFQHVQLFSVPAGEARALELGNASSGVYVPPGYVVFAQSGGLMAARFDLDALELIGAPVSVLPNVYTDLASGVALYDLSQNGTLVYMPARTENRVVWVSREGQTRSLMEASESFLLPRLSPDGRRLAVVVLDRSTNRRSVWVRDLERDTFTRLTAGEFEAAHEPVWSPDSRSIAFAATKTSGVFGRNIFVASLDGTGDPLQLTDSEQAVPSSWSRDGKLIFFHQRVQTGRDIGVVRVDEPGSEEIVLRDSFQKIEATLSPNGSWLAYMSNESGRREVYVRSYPSLDRKWLVSSDGGGEPLWAASGRELFYRSGTRMMVVEVAPGEDFIASRPEVLFERSFAVDTVGNDAVNYAVTADGESFVMIEEERASSGWNVVLNWTEELKRLLPIDN